MTERDPPAALSPPFSSSSRQGNTEARPVPAAAARATPPHKTSSQARRLTPRAPTRFASRTLRRPMKTADPPLTCVRGSSFLSLIAAAVAASLRLSQWGSLGKTARIITVNTVVDVQFVNAPNPERKDKLLALKDQKRQNRSDPAC